MAEVWSPEAVVHLWDGNDLNSLAALIEHLSGAVLAWSDRRCDGRLTLPAGVAAGERA